MPYIKNYRREFLIKAIENLANKIQAIPAEEKAGVINFAISKLLQLVYPEVRYVSENEIIGVLECIKMERYRKITAPYENKKINENGGL